MMKDKLRKKLITSYQKRKQIELFHPVINEKATLGCVPLLQATLLARAIRGDIPMYQALHVR